MDSIIYIIFAILGLSFLIFIHELGHYYMAKKVGMRVETFAIGFGRPIFSWFWNNVKWQIGWLPFGGYVKIAGTDLEADQDPYAVKDGFFGKGPWDRLKVAFMGPFVNLAFALALFSLLWVGGGRQKNYSEFTKKVGWVDPKSELYLKGVRPGDEITAYNSQEFQSSKDHLYAPMMSSIPDIDIQGFHVNYETSEKTPYAYRVKSYPHPQSLEKGVLTTGVLSSASYVYYDRLSNGAENPFPEGSPLKDSGIKYGDRIVWVDGEEIFSIAQMNQILNDERVLLTVQRGNETFLARVPRVLIGELKLSSQEQEELTDWQFDAGLNGQNIQNLYVIPYNLKNDGTVEARARFIDRDAEREAFPEHPFSKLEMPLQAEDRVIAISGKPIYHSSELLDEIQKSRVHVIVERSPRGQMEVSWRDADYEFDKSVDWKNLQAVATSIGTDELTPSSGNFFLLKPIVPKRRSELELSPERRAWLASEIVEQKKAIEALEDPEKRTQALRLLQTQERQQLLGLPNVQDRKVSYNPVPTEMFTSVFQEIWQTMKALVTGVLNPKWISGPIGIVQVVSDKSMVSLKEALFWLGAISLNLGVLNLMPIPMLDGGTILISFVELVTGKRLHPKTLEKIVIPFAILLIGFFIFLTYNDISRIFRS